MFFILNTYLGEFTPDFDQLAYLTEGWTDLKELRMHNKAHVSMGTVGA